MKGLPQATNFEESLANIYESKVFNTVLEEAKWRQPKNLANIAKRISAPGFEDHYGRTEPWVGTPIPGLGVNLNDMNTSAGVNLARLKQVTGGELRKMGRDKISNRVSDIEKQKKLEYRKKHGLMGDDEYNEWLKKQPVTNTHSKLLQRYGQKREPDPVKDEEVGDTLYRGQIDGGDPWKDGSYGGAYHYATPSRKTTNTYTGTPTGGAHSRILGSDKLRVIHRYKTNPGQLYGGSHGPEDVVAQRSPRLRRLERDIKLEPKAPGSPAGGLETAITKEKNPFIGTDLEGVSAEHEGPARDSYFFPAGKPALAAQNYAREMSKVLKSKEGNIEVGKPRFDWLSITPQDLSATDVRQPERLKKLEKKNPEALTRLMRRRANKYLFSNQK